MTLKLMSVDEQKHQAAEHASAEQPLERQTAAATVAPSEWWTSIAAAAQ
jgi:hypothetical protein